VATVARICRRLDGIPLAIELAAARLRSLAVEQLDARLDQRFRILTGGARTDEPRQQTLLALVEWSWELLTPSERTVLARGSVFCRGFELDAAETVLVGDEPDPWTVLDRLSSLVDKSLVEVGDDGRYRMLETMREFAAGKLEELGETEAFADAHLDYYLGLAVEAAPRLRSHDQLRWWARLDPELDNLTAALRHARTRSDPAAGLRLVIELRPYWSRHGLHGLADDALEALLARPDRVDARLHCRATVERAWHRARLGRFQDAIEHSEQSILEARAVGDDELLATALVTSYYDAIGVPERSLAHVQEALELATRLDNGYLESCALQRRAGVLRDSDHAEARRCIEQSLALDSAAGDQDGVQMALLNLALTDLDAHDTASARALAERALELTAGSPNPTFEAALLAALAWAELAEGHAAAARARFVEAVVLGRQVGDHSIMAEAIIGVALADPVAADAAVLHGAADAVLEQGAELASTDRRARDADVVRLRSLLGDDGFDECAGRGRTLPPSEIVAFARRARPDGDGSPR
jgi:tetratricopeptide (TPR) repeat protein